MQNQKRRLYKHSSIRHCDPWFSAHRSESIFPFFFFSWEDEGRQRSSQFWSNETQISVLAITKWNKNRISFFVYKKEKDNSRKNSNTELQFLDSFVRLTNLFCQQMSTKTKQGRYGYLWSAAIIHLFGASTESPWCLTKHFEMAKEAMKRWNINVAEKIHKIIHNNS